MSNLKGGNTAVLTAEVTNLLMLYRWTSAQFCGLDYTL